MKFTATEQMVLTAIVLAVVLLVGRFFMATIGEVFTKAIPEPDKVTFSLKA